MEGMDDVSTCKLVWHGLLSLHLDHLSTGYYNEAIQRLILGQYSVIDSKFITSPGIAENFICYSEVLQDQGYYAV